MTGNCLNLNTNEKFLWLGARSTRRINTIWPWYFYCAYQITWYLSSLTLCTVVVSKFWPLLGSVRHDQAMIYLFQKHLIFWEYEYIVYRNGIASKKLQSPVGYETMLERRENVWFTCSKNIYFVVSRSTLCIIMKLLARNCRVLWVTRLCFWNVEKTFVLRVPKTSTLLGGGVHCVS